MRFFFVHVLRVTNEDYSHTNSSTLVLQSSQVCSLVRERSNLSLMRNQFRFLFLLVGCPTD